MIEFEFYPPDKPWSTNQDRNLNPYKRHGTIREWKDMASLAYIDDCNKKKRKRQLGNTLIRVTIPFDKKRRRDPHNYCGTVGKAIIDGLVNAGAWDDDTPDFVEHLAPILVVGKSLPVKVELYPRRPMTLPCEHGFLLDNCAFGCDGGWTIKI